MLFTYQHHPQKIPKPHHSPKEIKITRIVSTLQIPIYSTPNLITLITKKKLFVTEKIAFLIKTESQSNKKHHKTSHFPHSQQFIKKSHF